MPERNIEVVADLAAMALAAGRHITALASQVIAEKDSFSIALCGGNTVRALLEVLASPPLERINRWDRWHIYFGDERCVPPDHSESNYGLARAALLERVPIPPENVYRMEGEIDPEAAAREYGQLLKEKFGEGGLDLVLLGMGEDGHTASLFPGTSALQELHHRCVANFVPQLNAWRITLTAPFINRARQVMVLVAGAQKARRVQQVLESPADERELPIQLIQPAAGRLLWLLDAAAAGMNDD
jgi:6-phosphogluconolactonase